MHWTKQENAQAPETALTTVVKSLLVEPYFIHGPLWKKGEGSPRGVRRGQVWSMREGASKPVRKTTKSDGREPNPLKILPTRSMEVDGPPSYNVLYASGPSNWSMAQGMRGPEHRRNLNVRPCGIKPIRGGELLL